MEFVTGCHQGQRVSVIAGDVRIHDAGGKITAGFMANGVWHGIYSSVFDNIPLTALALAQGGYDWGVLAYAVGFGGSMIWFGSSAGVALSNLFPEAKSVGAWLKGGWHIAVAYVIGFFVMLIIVGWHPHEPHKGAPVVQIP